MVLLLAYFVLDVVLAGRLAWWAGLHPRLGEAVVGLGLGVSLLGSDRPGEAVDVAAGVAVLLSMGHVGARIGRRAERGRTVLLGAGATLLALWVAHGLGVLPYPAFRVGAAVAAVVALVAAVREGTAPPLRHAFAMAATEPEGGDSGPESPTAAPWPEPRPPGVPPPSGPHR